MIRREHTARNYSPPRQRADTSLPEALTFSYRNHLTEVRNTDQKLYKLVRQKFFQPATSKDSKTHQRITIYELPVEHLFRSLSATSDGDSEEIRKLTALTQKGNGSRNPLSEAASKPPANSPICYIDENLIMRQFHFFNKFEEVIKHF